MKRAYQRQDRPARARSARRVGVAVAVAAIAVGFSACSDDGDDGDTDGTVAVDEDFPGDALDATCARLDAAEGDDQVAVATALLDELIQLGDTELAVNTLELAVIDRCPEWSDAVTAAIEARS